MKKIVLFIALLISLSVHAQRNNPSQTQKNTLLSAPFWKEKPTLDQVKAEVAKGNSPSESNAGSFDPLVMAINGDASIDIIKYLLDQPGNDVNKITNHLRTYIHWAAIKGNVEAMELFIAKGADLNIADSHGATPLAFAASMGQQNTKVYDLLIAKGVDIKNTLSSNGANVLLLAVASDKDFKLTNYFVSKGLDIKSTDAEGNNAFYYAARRGNVETLKALLNKGIVPSDKAFLAATQSGRGPGNTIEVYQYLESLKLKPTVIGKNGENVLHNVVGKPNQAEVINYFISKGVDVNKVDNDGTTVFMRAATSGKTDVLESLSKSVKNINQVNAKGQSALTFAVLYNTPEAVEYLIGKGANLNVVDINGENLSSYLLQSYSPRNSKNFAEKLELLKTKGYDLSVPQKNGNNLYHLAIVKTDLDLLKTIEPLKIDINAKNAEGLTPLHRAAMVSQDDEILKYLIALGAKKDAVTGFQETAYDLASENEIFTKNKIAVDFLK